MHGAAKPNFFFNCTLEINIDTLITGWACPRCSFVVPSLIEILFAVIDLRVLRTPYEF